MSDTKRTVMVDEYGQPTGYYVKLTIASDKDGMFKAELEYNLPKERGYLSEKVNPLITCQLFEELYDHYEDKLIEECIDDD